MEHNHFLLEVVGSNHNQINHFNAMLIMGSFAK
jgi:hypothetical protein